MSKRLRIFQATRQGSVPVLTIELDGGRAKLTAGTDDPAASAFIESLVGDGVDSVREDPAASSGLSVVRVTAEDGAAYLDAVEDMLGRSSRWIVVPE